ncbi:sensor histidine kinase [Rhizobium sp. S152]|uniref:sensor histidine kinase n=1 Tax=Rhizobium sp. S152 TaxID=3055038 RepID=UPI0025A9AE4D|nr:sensor histidine kinase [Rhizobium sp. S152]MDM9628453.1 sensor histidine kinase [Rhizobium sp. S152]
MRAENHQKLLINELNHRVKNTLSSIQSIVALTLRGEQSKQEASASITSRILALSRAHNILTNENWDGADLHQMVESALEAFQQDGRVAIRIEGPPLRVGPHAALSLALALHELGTNAVKYGALSNGTGTVTVDWNVDPNNRFTLDWTEQGGPNVIIADRQGFGSRLLLRILPKELQGTAGISFASSGVTFKLETSLEAVSDRSLVDGS